MKYYFLSSGRSGTTYLFKLLEELYPELNITHQVFGSRLINIVSNSPLNEKLSVNTLIFLYKYIRKDTFPSSTVDPLQSLAISKIINNTNHLDDEFKIIHIVRNPFDFVRSFMNWKNSSFKRLVLHHVVPFWQPNPRMTKIKTKSKLNNKFKHFCKVWYLKNNEFYENFHDSKNYKRFKIEDLTVNPSKKEHYLNLINFMELPIRDFDYNKYAQTKINQSSGNSFVEYELWNTDMKHYLNSICGKLMKTFGYI